MAITNLSGTKWQINSVNCSAGYGVFNVGGLTYNDTNYGADINQIYIGYSKVAGEFEPVSQANSVMLYSQVIGLSIGDIIEFTDESGSDLTNTNLISWLEQNATQIVETDTYTLRLNGKNLSLLNGRKVRNLIYKGTTYKIS